MYSKILHHRLLRLFAGILGTLISALGVNLFIVPQCFYSGGLYGTCQVIRTLLIERVELSFPFDPAGILYFLLNIPLLFLAFRTLGRKFVLRLIVCTVSSSLFLSLIPIPSVPIVSDPLTSCLLGGIVSGFGGGVVLTCGCSSGGLDILGLYLSKKGSAFTVGRFSLSYNAVLYLICGLLFDVNTAIYSAIYNVFSALFLDRIHQQNVTVQVLIFTKNDVGPINNFVLQNLSRGLTYWSGKGAYTNETVNVLCICMNKYEVASLQQTVQEKDPHAFFIVQEGVRTHGNFERHLT